MIVLVGFMGAGKSTVGALLAARLGLPFKDTDEMIVERTGSSIAEIFDKRGEAVFRNIEKDVIRDVLEEEDAVVSLGGGALTDHDTADALEDLTVVHLFVDHDEAIRRIGGDGERPMLEGDSRSLYGRRLGTYEVIADDVVQTDDLTPDEVAEEIVHRLRLVTHASAGTYGASAVTHARPPDEHPRLTEAPPLLVEDDRPPRIPEPHLEETVPSGLNGRGDAPPRDASDALVADPEAEPELSQTAAAPQPAVPQSEVDAGAQGEIPAVQITVAAASRWYEVVVGSGVMESTAQFVPIPEDAEKVFLVTHTSLLKMARAVAATFEAEGLRPIVIEVPEGETAKSLETAANAYELMAAAQASRHDLVVGVGGGVVTDLAGFLASTFNRGMAVAYVPTTLLGQVDAAIGGKTAINLPDVKNKVGTFHQPVAVVCDADALWSLPAAELTSGLAEVVKYGLIADHSLLQTVLEDAQRINNRDAGVLADLVTRSVAVKAEVVAADERDVGRRAILNYGHTVGHAIESLGDYKWFRHGEAISLGMMAAAYIAQQLWDLPEGLANAHRKALEAAGLPIRAKLDVNEVIDALTQDKKYRRGVRFVLLREQGKPETDVQVPDEVVRAAIHRLIA